MSRAFVADRDRGVWLGVCRGFADATGTPVGLVRFGVLFLTIAALGLPGVLAYLLIGWLAR